MFKIILCGATLDVSADMLDAFLIAISESTDMVAVCENGVWQARDAREAFAGLVATECFASID